MALTSEDVEWLATVISSEAGSVYDKGNWVRCTDEERAAVSWTVLNRLRSGTFGQTIKEVVTAPGQYAHNQEPTSEIGELAKKLLEGRIPDATGGATHFFSPIGMPKEGESTTGFDIGGGLHEVPAIAKKVYFPSWTQTMTYVGDLKDVRKSYFMFYRSETPITTPAPAPTPALSSDVKILESSLYVRDDYEAGFSTLRIFTVLGEVQNTGTEWVTNIEVTATFYDERGYVLGQVMTSPEVGRLSPERKLPFALDLYGTEVGLKVATEEREFPPDFDLEVNWETASPSLVYEGLEILSAEFDPVNKKLEVEVHNAGTEEVSGGLVVTFYDAAGRVLYYAGFGIPKLIPNQVKTMAWSFGRSTAGEFLNKISDYSMGFYSDWRGPYSAPGPAG